MRRRTLIIFGSMLVVAVTSAAADAQASLKKRSDNARVTRYRGGPEIAQQVAFSFDAGDSYPSSTGPRALKRLAGLISVTLSSARPTGSAIQELTGLGGPFEGYAVESRVRHGRVILSGSAAQRRAQVDNPQLRSAALATARKIRGVVSANPVFMDPKTGRRLVLAQGVVVKLRPGAEPSGSLAGASFRQLAGTTDQFIIDLPAATAEEIFQEVSRRARQPEIEWAEPDMIPQMVKHFVPNDPLFSQQWHLRNLGVSPQRNDADIDAPEAWDTSRGSTNIVIAILDDGVELDHPDLSPNIFRNPGEVLNNIDDDGNGYVDDIRGWDFFDIDNDPNPVFFDDTHGTAVAGVAVAVADNGLGVAGSGFSCRLLPIRMVGVSLSEAAQAVYYAAGRGSDGVSRWRGADIISISLGFPQSAVTDAAFAWAATNGRNGNGCPIFVASGNEASLWHTVELSDIGAGLHTYEWVFVKDESISEGEDTVWLDGIVFPDKAIQSFESPLLPNGFSTFGNAPWFSVQDGVGNNHALTGWSGQNARAIRSGDISDNQTSGLRTSRFYARTGSLVFSAWVSAEFDDNFYFDRLDFLLDGVREFSIDGDPLAPIFVELDYPASHPDTIAVGACTDFDFRADYSCYAGDLDYLDFVAPSDGGFTGIVTTDLLGFDGYTETNYVTQFGGTSASCPLAAGVAGLVLAVNTNLSSRNVRQLMQATCDPIGGVSYTNGTNLFYGHGRINAARAVTNALPRIHSVQSIGGDLIIRFGSVNGWAYDLDRASGLDGPWSPAQSNIAGTGDVIVLSEPRSSAPAIRRFYRLSLQP